MLSKHLEARWFKAGVAKDAATRVNAGGLQEPEYLRFLLPLLTVNSGG